MALFTKYVPNLFTKLSKCIQPVSTFHSLSADCLSPVNPGGLFNILTRTIIRIHFPRPCEKKRIKRHGWAKRMSTPSGRRVIMNRILKGRYVYTH